MQNDLRLLGMTLSDAKVHQFMPGRKSNMPQVVDVFERGVTEVLDSKLDAFHLRMLGTAKFEEVNSGASLVSKPSEALDPETVPLMNPDTIADLMLPDFADCGLASDGVEESVDFSSYLDLI